MATVEITNNASATLQVWSPVYKLDQTFTAAGTLVYPKGMLLTLTAGKYVMYTASSGNAHGILIADVDATAGAGDFPVSVLIGGEVREDQCGTGQTLVALTSADILGLQNFGMITRVTNQLGELDNQ
jgi:hypothetical protein